MIVKHTTPPRPQDMIVDNADKPLSREGRIARIRRGMRYPEILNIVGSEMVIDPVYGKITKDEYVMRGVFELAMAQDKWAIEFIVNRREGRPVNRNQNENLNGDVRDMPTGMLLDMIANQGAAIEAAVDERINALVASGRIVIVEQGEVVQSDSQAHEVEKSESDEG